MALIKRVVVQSDIQCISCKGIIHPGDIAIKDRSSKYEITPAVKAPRRVASSGCQGTTVMEVLHPKKVVRHPERPTLYYCESCFSKKRHSVRRRANAQAATG